LPKKIFNHLKRKLSLSHESSPGDFISQRSVAFVLSAVMPITAENLRLAIESTSVLQNDLENTDRRLLMGLPSATRPMYSAFHFGTSYSRCDSNHRPAPQIPALLPQCF
jgi:hypothetical protein